ncbi:hypothetical protein M5K25_001443 [Dendrobium thyrsiflorum]|uniref:C2 domain-containing protein n=2 Tax=Dendrobium thyrsiflorum TaxID=117978 RepID=A0ABD0VQE5_DENTH
MSPEGSGTSGNDFLLSPRPPPSTFNLLEVTLISAQDLFPSSRSLHTYAVAWLHPSHRLRTRLDSIGHTSPTWNDKFLFRIDDSTLCSDTSAIQINIYAARPRFLPGPDTLLGTTRAILSTLHLSPSTRFFALQVRRPTSLRPQGILNIGIGIADPYVCSLPLYANLRTSAFAYHDLMAAAMSAKPKKKGDLKGLIAAQPRLPQPQPQPAALDRSGSVSGSGEKERVVLEKKLKKWRSEIWAVEDQMGWEKGGQSPAATDDEGGSRRGKPRRPRAMSCFNLAGQYADENEEDDNSSTSSWSSNSQR